MKLKMDKKFEEESTCRFKIAIRNLTNFDLSTQRILLEIWRKTELLLGKWHEEFGKFSPEHWKVSKLRLWWDSFAQSRKCMTLKFTEELSVMTIKNDTKIEEELTCRFKIDMRNFTNFDPSTWKSKKFVLIGSLWPKYILFEL